MAKTFPIPVFKELSGSLFHIEGFLHHTILTINEAIRENFVTTQNVNTSAGVSRSDRCKLSSPSPSQPSCVCVCVRVCVFSKFAPL